LVLGKALEKAVLRPAFSHKSKVAFPKLKFWESLGIMQYAIAYIPKGNRSVISGPAARYQTRTENIL
jgi:hypothetical protein